MFESKKPNQPGAQLGEILAANDQDAGPNQPRDLTTAIIGALEPRAAAYKIQDDAARGLYLIVAPNGRKRWIFRYMLNRKADTLSGGKWPTISLEAARSWAAIQRDMIDRDINPRDEAAIASPSASTGASFEKRAREWHALQTNHWSPGYCLQTMGSLERDIFPAPVEGSRLKFGQLKLDQITAPMCLAVVRGVEARGALDVAIDIQRLIGQVFKWAHPLGYCKQTNPAADIRGAMLKHVRGHHAADHVSGVARILSTARGGKQQHGVDQTRT